MNKISKEHLLEMIQSELFENSAQINLPVDDGMYAQNTRGSHFDRPYAQEDQVPLAASDFVTNKNALTIKDFDPKDKDFMPKNLKEFVVAMSSVSDDIGMNAVSQSDIRKMWEMFIKILEKNDNWGSDVK